MPNALVAKRTSELFCLATEQLIEGSKRMDERTGRGQLTVHPEP